MIIKPGVLLWITFRMTNGNKKFNNFGIIVFHKSLLQILFNSDLFVHSLVIKFYLFQHTSSSNNQPSLFSYIFNPLLYKIKCKNAWRMVSIDINNKTCWEKVALVRFSED